MNNSTLNKFISSSCRARSTPASPLELMVKDLKTALEGRALDRSPARSRRRASKAWTEAQAALGSGLDHTGRGAALGETRRHGARKKHD